MTQPIEAVVIVHFDDDGQLSYHVAGDERVRLFIVDERAPRDRVYEWTSRCGSDEIGSILGSDPIGSSQDARHAALAARINGEGLRLVGGDA